MDLHITRSRSTGNLPELRHEIQSVFIPFFEIVL